MANNMSSEENNISYQTFSISKCSDSMYRATVQVDRIDSSNMYHLENIKHFYKTIKTILIIEPNTSQGTAT